MITVYVSVGIGNWKAAATVSLVACPHVGDFIEVHERIVTCERVTITSQYVYVSETQHFQSEEQAKEYFR